MEYITTANVLVFVFLALGLFLMFVSYWLAAAALFPEQIERCQRQFGTPIVTTLVGLLLFAVPLVAGVAITKALPSMFKWVGLALTAAPVLIGLVGSAGLARRIGVGLASPIDAEQPWRAVLRGGVVLSLTFLLPVLGQVLVIPLVLAAGTGAAVFSWFRGRKPAVTAGVVELDVPAGSAS